MVLVNVGATSDLESLKPRNGRWTEPADAEDVEAEVSTFSENHRFLWAMAFIAVYIYIYV